jgi:hypothetical protein
LLFKLSNLLFQRGTLLINFHGQKLFELFIFCLSTRNLPFELNNYLVQSTNVACIFQVRLRLNCKRCWGVKALLTSCLELLEEWL